jgi:hypothetical protein
MSHRTLLLTLMLTLTLLLAACGSDATDDEGLPESGEATPIPSSDPQIQATEGVGEPSSVQASENQTPEATGNEATGGEVVSQGEEADDDETDSGALISALNLPLPEGATMMEMDDDSEAAYSVPNMSPEEVMTFFRDNMPGAGYELSEEDEDSFHFQSNDVRGDIKVEEMDGGTSFTVDIN